MVGPSHAKTRLGTTNVLRLDRRLIAVRFAITVCAPIVTFRLILIFNHFSYYVNCVVTVPVCSRISTVVICSCVSGQRCSKPHGNRVIRQTRYVLSTWPPVAVYVGHYDRYLRVYSQTSTFNFFTRNPVAGFGLNRYAQSFWSACSSVDCIGSRY